MTDPVIDLTDYSFSDHGNRLTVTAVLELVDDGRFIQTNRPQRRNTRTSRRYQNDDTETRILNEIPIEVTDSPQVNLDSSGRRKKAARTSNAKNRGEKASDKPDELLRDRSPIGGIGVCPICLDRLGDQPLVSTRCGHVYCATCLTRALRAERKCPTCRKSLRGATAYHPLYLDSQRD